jgi:hypothetical protein
MGVMSWVLLVYICDPLGRLRSGGSRFLANSSQDPISKITTAKYSRDVVQAVECLLCRCGTLSSNSNPSKKGKRKEHRVFLQTLSCLSPDKR